ncbi:MAG: hypothetical protein MJ100_08510 [Ruminococcus sp.]|nr:hypothetical protein [Ruminococcus sp.]
MSIAVGRYPLFRYALNTEKIENSGADGTFAEWKGNDGSGEWKNGSSENK